MPVRTALILSVVVLATSPAAARAQEPLAGGAAAVPAAPAPTGVAPAREPSSAEGRTLNGHVFMPSFVVASPLTTTSFGTYFLLGYGSASATYQVADRTYSGTFDYAGTGAALGYEYAFQRYFSARFTLNDVIYSGIDGPSAIVVGTSLQFAGSIGATASLPLGDTAKIGVLFDAGVTPGLGLTIGNGIRTIIDECAGSWDSCPAGEGSIFGTHKATTLQPAVAASWAPMRALGLTANVAYLHVSQKVGDSTFTGQAMTLAGAADWDFKAVSSVPVGLQLVFSWTAPFDGDVLQHVTDFGGGVFYTGSEHLALSLQVVSRRFAVQPTVDVSWSTYLTTIGLRYYW